VHPRSSLALALAWLALAPRAGADSDFIPLPVPESTPTPPPAEPRPNARDDVERAGRESRQRREQRRIEQGGSKREVEAQRVREQLALERDTGGPVPAQDAERVRADLERAQRRREIERDAERTRKRIDERASPDATSADAVKRPN
jgi:hypothetical protein